MNRFFSTILMLFVVAVCAFSQTMKENYESFRNQVGEGYSDFRDKTNQEYVQFMRKAWKWYEEKRRIPLPVIKDEFLSPVVISEEDNRKNRDDKVVVVDDVIPPLIVTPSRYSVEPIPDVPQPKESLFVFSFFGTECKVRIGEEQRFVLKGVDENSVADIWGQLSTSKYNNVIRDCLLIRETHTFCDWAYYLMLEKLCSGFYHSVCNEAVLLQAFLFNQSGYKIRLARNSANQLFLLVASDFQIYERNYYIVDGETFYKIDNVDVEGLYIYDRAYEKENTMSMAITTEQLFDNKFSSKRTFVPKRYPNLALHLATNQNLIDFYDHYLPSAINHDEVTRWRFYANAPLSQSVKEQIYPQLLSFCEGKSESEVANILLDIVQTAFVYEYDEKMWGGDRAFFSDETLHYPCSDCEDRSILFSRLIRDLLGLKVVLLYYPEHLATAVCFNENVKGDYLMVNNVRYIVCDPTYIGASIGLTMPKMDNRKAIAIQLE